MKIIDIIEGCKNDDKRCQEYLVRTYAPMLMAICRRYTGDSTSAYDALQETFINIFKYIGGYGHKGSFEGWLKRIAINCSITFRKKHINKIGYEYNDEVSPYFTIVPDVYSKLNEEELLKTIEKLPGNLGLVFNLYVIEGYSHKEIASMLDMSVGNSRSALSRARNWLIKELKKENIWVAEKTKNTPPSGIVTFKQSLG